MVFPKLLGVLLKFQIHYPDCHVKTLLRDNAKKFKSQYFEDFYVASYISFTYWLPYEHS